MPALNMASCSDGKRGRKATGSPAHQTRRTNVPHRKQEPIPANDRPLGLWTEPGTFPSYRNGYSISFWGDLQLDFLTIMEADPAVLEIRSRPEPVQWFDGDCWHEHTPAFSIRTRQGFVYFDVLPEKDAESTEYRRKHAAVKAVLAQRGIGFRHITKTKLRIQPRLDNARLVYMHSGEDVSQENKARVERLFKGGSAMTAAEVADRSSLPFGEALAAVLNLVWLGVLSIDMGKEIGRNSIVRRPA
ncbi:MULTISPECIES: hypothetical protein [unclassified Mesorhizobium]|uniref:hypothetical protein n=1 Tax=unclassified Mesorhizobium TaxID=325217 RepID=UPI001128597F|nr:MULTISPECIES: hypothetical protein [unclassified Mesorhizobium]TPK93183.1 hypothetical protein FJ567_26855 [Mesorhizobium sp. B2-4-16]TPL73235.1 hypothetical protein FJ956_10380 [Mesorhizobium sp. B2-4-3]